MLQLPRSYCDLELDPALVFPAPRAGACARRVERRGRGVDVILAYTARTGSRITVVGTYAVSRVRLYEYIRRLSYICYCTESSIRDWLHT